MVISSSPNNSQQLDALLRNCLSQRLEPNEFFEEACRMVIEENAQFAERALLVADSYASTLIDEDDIFPLALDYLKILFLHGFIHPQQYLNILTSFDCWNNPIRIEEIALQLQSFINNKRIIASNDNSNEIYTQISIMLDWYIYSLEKIVEIINENNFNDFFAVFIKMVYAIKQLHEQPFTALIIFIFFTEHSDKSYIDDNIDRLQTISNLSLTKEHLNESKDENDSTSKDDEMDIDEEKEIKEPSFQTSRLLKLLDELIELFPSFSTPPKSKWQPCKEDFIHRKHRPALLSLGSIFAIFRVIKTADEVADTFLTVGNILGMEHEQIVEDLLRAGFLIQLETSNTCSEQREREALADVFVFIKLPQVLNLLIARGIKRQTISKALERICNCDSLLDQVDAIKSDNVFHFFLDGLKKADVINSKEHEFLTKKRDLKRAQNDELPPTSTSEHQINSRSFLILKVQKAKKAIDTLEPKNTKMLLMRLLSSGEIPLDMLCSIYCACGELSLFSSKLAALNAQAQQQIGENVSGATTNDQDRLLIFDSTFLLMARIQHVFTDMRLEELVGGRLHCAFYRWTQRYQKCIEEGESMCFVLSSQTGVSSSDDFTNESSFRSNFQRNQFQSMRTHKQPYWLAENNDFGNTIETVPLIGELLLEEFSRGSPNSTEINNIFWTFSQMSCLWLCLVQWLDAQQPTIGNTPRQSMARAMREFEIKLQQQKTATEKDNKDEKDNKERHQSLSYSILIARRLLRQIADHRTKKEHPYTWLIGFAQRPLPALPVGRKMSLLRADLDEIKEENQRLKEVFLCANQQSWATPDAIAHINRCNESCRMDIWLQCWMRQMMNHQRIVTVDEGELASELCLAATITYPVPCLCEMIKQLVECVLFERPTSTSSSTNLIAPSASAPNIVSVVSTINPNEHSLEEQKPLTTKTQQKHSLSAIEQQQQILLQQQIKPSSHPTLSHLMLNRHPVVGQLSTKATVIAKMLVRAMQLLLWAGDRRVLEKRERERRIQQFGLTTQQPLEQSFKKRNKQEINENKEEMECTPSSSTSSEQQQNEAKEIQKKKNSDFSSAAETSTTSTNETTTPRLPKDALKAQLTVSNVFERFERIVRECNLRPPVTFIIFFIHELAAAPQTEYWRRLVSIMPVNLIFALAHLDPHAIPLNLFMRLYDPEDEKNRKLCIKYAFMIRKLGNI